MSAQAILKEASGLGAKFRVTGDDVQFKGSLPPGLLTQLRANKAEIIAFLRKVDCAASPP